MALPTVIAGRTLLFGQPRLERANPILVWST
jgi:hypothetical protein